MKIVKFCSRLINKNQKIFKLRFLPEHPHKEDILENIVYIVDKNYKKWAYLLCPCGCKEVILLSLLCSKNPSWSIKFDFLQRPTVYPSIYKLNGCKSHFLIREGKTFWIKEDGF